MNYLFWVVGLLITLAVSCYAWKKYEAADIRNIKSLPKMELIAVIVAFVITAASYVICAIREYTITDIIIVVIVYTMLLSSAMIDYKFHIIPNRIIITAGILRVALLAVEYFINPQETVPVAIDCAIGGVVGFGLLFIVSLISKQGIGMGDVKLIGILGIILGVLRSYNVLFYSLLALLIFAAVMWFLKKVNRKSQIPFAPFVFIGYVLVLLMNIV